MRTNYLPKIGIGLSQRLSDLDKRIDIELKYFNLHRPNTKQKKNVDWLNLKTITYNNKIHVTVMYDKKSYSKDKEFIKCILKNYCKITNTFVVKKYTLSSPEPTVPTITSTYNKLKLDLNTINEVNKSLLDEDNTEKIGVYATLYVYNGNNYIKNSHYKIEAAVADDQLIVCINNKYFMCKLNDYNQWICEANNNKEIDII